MPAAAYPALALFIAGRFVAAGGRATTPVLNPATEAVLGALPHATADDLAAAMAAGADGFRLWRGTSPLERGRVLRRAADLMREQAEAIATLITLELGKPLGEARVEVETAAGLFEWNAEEGRRAYGRVIPARQSGIRQLALREPLGPIAAFAPWNAPAITPARKISSALAAGCSVIIKPAEETPATALAMARILHEAGLPPGVLSVVFGNPAFISETLLASPIIRGVTFTGSTAVGRQLAAQAALGLKPMTMELGGHAPVLVFGDVDAEATARAAAAAKFRNAGQICTSPTRFYVHRSIYDRFADAFAAAAASITVGDGFDPATRMGPLATSRRIDAMDRLVADARARGVTIAAGGKRRGNHGFFYAPTVLRDAPDDCLAANEEPFGPLALLKPFDDVDEALALANRLPVGLAAYAMTHDSRLAERAAAGIDAGNVVLNHWQASLPETPFGGVRDSGMGREGGIEGLEAFQQVKYVSSLG
ncbi:NAD-dependent succinate-semialdehyde dehydrogenase [Chelatococcus reniformis]|uniref:NAD-dependent succinate-semialdehyde dehydrogenase n=1 Tax=Chelatococcus reniformis TaxID=1494448 RepID=A0A916U0X9_9HYPH|nr:NAD-dependent succinate-semialdehyde dehydrogenase [Chelatococcus reniformis]